MDEDRVMKEVLDYIWGHLGCNTNDIIESLDIPPELVKNALSKLSENNIIEQACIVGE